MVVKRKAIRGRAGVESVRSRTSISTGLCKQICSQAKRKGGTLMSNTVINPKTHSQHTANTFTRTHSHIKLTAVVTRALTQENANSKTGVGGRMLRKEHHATREHQPTTLSTDHVALNHTTAACRRRQHIQRRGCASSANRCCCGRGRRACRQQRHSRQQHVGVKRQLRQRANPRVGRRRIGTGRRCRLPLRNR